jgi:hypothetical protein
MAFDFKYCVSLSIVHPSLDPRTVSATIVELSPRIESMAGEDRRGRDGNLLTPHRKVQLSHWLAPLHEEEYLRSESTPLSDFILEWAKKLMRYQTLLLEIGCEGSAKFSVGWFSDSTNSAAALSADALKACGDLGIGIDLDFYAPRTVAAS